MRELTHCTGWICITAFIEIGNESLLQVLAVFRECILGGGKEGKEESWGRRELREGRRERVGGRGGGRELRGKGGS